MIIPSLIQYYDRLATDPEQDVAPFGYSRQNVSFIVVLHGDGRLERIEPAIVTNEVPAGRGKTKTVQRPLSLVVPGQAKPPGSGLNPCFLWDNLVYLLGYKPDDPKPDRTREAHRAFVDKHLALRDIINDSAFHAVCSFFEHHWSPEIAAAHAEALSQLAAGFGVFRVLPETGYVHDRPTVRAWWEAQLASISTGDASVAAISLLDNHAKPIARLHEPKIKGVVGGNPSGAVLVGFNADAFESYGKSQSYNAPIGADEAFKYCTALNKLLADPTRRVRLADTTVVFWADAPTAFAEGFAEIFSRFAASAEDATPIGDVGRFLSGLQHGTAAPDPAERSVGFYVLGLAPNVARVAVRFFLRGTVGEFHERLTAHLARLNIVGNNDRPPSISSLVNTTARIDSAGKPDYDSVNPRLAGEIARAILGGTPYPQQLLGAVIRRIGADGHLNPDRAAVIKATLTHPQHPKPREVSVSLDVNRTDPPYLLGRLFALFEKTQEDASGGKLNRTIKDGYFSTAAATPAGIFPRLCRLHQHHIEKLDGGHKINRQRDVQSVVAGLQSFPRTLSLEDQGVFFIGYYHQRQDLFTKKTKTDSLEPEGDNQ